MEQRNEALEKFIIAASVVSNRNYDNTNFKEAESYLLALEKSMEAWTIIPEILNSDGFKQEVYIQAVLILKRKLQFDFYQLPENEYLNLTEVIIRFLLKFDDKAIGFQLALSLGIIYMHAYEKIGNILEPLGKTLFTKDGKELVTLQVLEMLAAVALDKSVVIDAQKKQDYTKFLQENIEKDVLAILDKLSSLPNVNDDLRNQILVTFQEWIIMCRTDKDTLKLLAQSNCFLLALEGMNNERLAANCSECLRRMMKSVKRAEDWPELFGTIYKYLPQYIEKCNQVLETDEEHAIEYTKVFINFGRKLITRFFNNPSEDLANFLKFLLELTARPDFDALEELESFWNTLAEEFDSLNPNEQALKLSDFQPVFAALQAIAVNKMTLSEDELGLYDKGLLPSTSRVLEFKKKERKYCKALIEDVLKVVGLEFILLNLTDIMRQLIESVQQNTPNWEVAARLEGIFLAAKTIIKEINADVEVNFDDFFDVMIQVKVHHVKYRRTRDQLVAYMSEHAKLKNNEVLGSIFTFLAEDLADKTTTEAAGNALISLCQEFSGFVVENFEKFLALIDNIKNNSDLIVSLALAVGNSENQEIAQNYLAQLCKPFAERIIENANRDDALTNQQVLEAIYNDLMELSAIFSQLIPEKDSQANKALDPIFAELWPYLKQLLIKFKSIPKMVEKICSVIKKAMKGLGLRFAPYLIEYLKTISENHKEYPHSAYLYAVEVMAGVFGKEPEARPTLIEAYEYMCQATYNYFSGNQKIEDNLEMVEDFFGMLFRYTKYIPEVNNSPQILETNLEFANLVIGIQHPEVNKALYLFIDYIMRRCYEQPLDEGEKIIHNLIVNKYGSIFIMKLLGEYIKYPSEQEREYIIDIIFNSYVRIKDLILQWLQQAFELIPKDILTVTEKNELIKKLSKLKTSHLNPREGTKDEKEKEKLVFEKFDRYFDLFDFRCNQHSKRSRY